MAGRVLINTSMRLEWGENIKNISWFTNAMGKNVNGMGRRFEKLKSGGGGLIIAPVVKSSRIGVR